MTALAITLSASHTFILGQLIGALLSQKVESITEKEMEKEAEQISRKLDSAIAEVLGYEVLYARFYDKSRNIYEDKNLPSVRMYNGYQYGCPYYSKDGSDMLKLDKEMQERRWDLTLWREGHIFYAVYEPTDRKIWNNPVVIGSNADTEPLARALAAYKALTGKKWKGGGE